MMTMIPRPRPGQDPTAVNPSWVQVYRDMCEWAVLHERICRTEFPSDTLIVRDSLLRSKIFHGTLFIKLRDRLEEGMRQMERGGDCMKILVSCTD